MSDLSGFRLALFASMKKERDVNENPSERRGSEQLRQARQGRQSGERRERSDAGVGHTPGLAEGEERDIDAALKRDVE